MVELVNIKINDTDITKYIFRFLKENTMIVTKDFLKSRYVPDIGSIEICSEDYRNESNNLTQEI